MDTVVSKQGRGLMGWLVKAGLVALIVAGVALLEGASFAGRRPERVPDAPVEPPAPDLPARPAGKRRWRIVGRVLDMSSNVALVLLVTVVTFVVIAPHLFGWRYGILRSGSMSPAMPAGSAIVLKPAGMEDVRPGDVITYRSGQNQELLVTHRVVSLTDDGSGKNAAVTKGDANEESDQGFVTSDRLLGKVVFDVPWAGRISQKLRTRTAFLLLIAVPTALIIAFESRELARGVRDVLKDRRRVEA